MIVKVIDTVNSKKYHVHDNADVRHILINFAKHINAQELDLYKYITDSFDEQFNVCEDNVKSDFIVDIDYLKVRLFNVKEKSINYILFNKPNGNCVDKLLQHILLDKLQTIHYLYTDIDSRCDDRDKEINYHNSNIFENDFLDLSRIKSIAQSIVDNINKFQEDITLTDYA